MINQRPARLDPTDSDHLTYALRIPLSVKLENVLDENFWANVAMTLKPWDRIQIQPEDFSYSATLVVVARDRLWAKVALEFYTELSVGSPSIDELKVQWSGPHTKYRVLRGTTVMQDKFDTKTEAEKWRDGHVKPAKAA